MPLGQQFLSVMETHQKTAQHLPPRETGGLLARSSSSRQLQLRENYIVNRDNNFNRLTAGEVHKLINTPNFNRFISLNKNNIQNADNLIDKLSPRPERRKNLERSFNRRQIFLIRQKRAEHNSPLKARKSRTGEKEQQKKEEKSKTPHIKIEESENAMLIKKLVTHIEQPHKTVAPIQDPYSPRSFNKYYVAQAIKQYQNPDSLVREHLFSSIYFLTMLNNYALSQNQPQMVPLSLPKKDKYRDKLTVVFDLDETLVHCFEQLTQPHQIEIPVKFNQGGFMIAPLNIRPGAKELLSELSLHFELIVFTASHECYADAVIDYLDPKRQYIQHRLYRQNCVYIDQGYYVKDLRLLGRDLSKLVLIDNAAYSYSFQLDNGIPILPYYEGSTDYQLKALRLYLLTLTGDVRQANRKAFRLNQYIKYSDVQQLVSQLYL